MNNENINPVTIEPVTSVNPSTGISALLDIKKKGKDDTKWFYMNGNPKSPNRANARAALVDIANRKLTVQVIYLNSDGSIDNENSIEWNWKLQEGQEFEQATAAFTGGDTNVQNRNTKSPQTLNISDYKKVVYWPGDANSRPAIAFVNDNARREYACEVIAVK